MRESLLYSYTQELSHGDVMKYLQAQGLIPPLHGANS